MTIDLPAVLMFTRTRLLTIFDPSPHNLEFDVYSDYIHVDIFWLSSEGVVLSICWSVMLGLPDMFKTFGIAAASAIMVCAPGLKRIQIVNLPEEICPAVLPHANGLNACIYRN